MPKKIIDLEVLKSFRQRLDNRYVQQVGYLPNLHVGLADEAINLTPYGENSGAIDDAPFVFQTSGGNSDISDRAYLRTLKGNTIVFNQLVHQLSSTYWGFSDATGSFSDGIATFTATSQYGGIRASINLLEGHKYLLKAKIKKSSSTSDIRLAIRDSYVRIFSHSEETTNYQYLYGFRTIETASSTNNILVIDNGAQDFSSVEVRDFQVFDLTQMFGADNEPNTLLDFNRLLLDPYYDYNNGSLLSSKSNSYKIVGYNALNPETLVFGQSISTISGGTYINNNAVRSTYIKVIAGEKYTIEVNGTHTSIYYCEYDEKNNFIKGDGITSGNPITLSDTTHYLRFSVQGYGNTFNDDICIHLTWDNSKTGYEAYNSKSYTLPNIELRSAGLIYDELKPDGTLTRKIGVYTCASNYAIGDTITISDIKANTTNVLSKYGFLSEFATISGDTLTLTKTLLIDDVIHYELNTPTSTQNDEYAYQELTEIDDFGTQEFLSSQSVIVPQGNYFFYPVDYKSFIDSLGGREDIDYDANEIVSHTELQTAIGQIPSADFSSISESVLPATTNTYDLGSSTYTWKDLYLGGKINQNVSGYGLTLPNTTSFTADKEIATTDQTFNVINASDIVSNTLTQAQYALIRNGKPTLIKGTLLGMLNPILLTSSPLETFGVIIGANISGNYTAIKYYEIYASGSNYIIQIYGNKRIEFSNLYSINGKEIPNYPSNTGTFVLKCVNGTLTWVAE